MNKLKQTNLPVWIAACCLLIAGWGCSAETTLDRLPEEGTAVDVVAEISGIPGTKTAVPETNYDRSSFINTDKIRIYRSGTGIVAQQADYAYATGSGSGSWAVQTGSVTLKAGAEYYAVYPSDYERILQDQSAVDGSGFLKSNQLKSGTITTPRDGVLHFTDTRAFKHQNVKLTLVIKNASSSASGGESWNGVFTNTRLSGTGLLTKDGGEENITLFQPDPDVRTWCGIAYPQNKATGLKVQLTYQGVFYTVTLSCGLVPDTHYKYTLTLQDNKLVPQGSTIEGWKSDPDKDYAGDFNNGTL